MHIVRTADFTTEKCIGKKTSNESLPSSTSNMSATLKDLMVLLHDLDKDSSKSTEINKNPETEPLLLRLKHPAPPSSIENPEIYLSDDDSSTLDVEDDSNEASSNANPSSSLCITVSKSKIGIMEKKCEACDKTQRFFKKRSKQTSFRSPVARSLIATGLSSCPALSNTSATTLFCCAI